MKSLRLLTISSILLLWSSATHADLIHHWEFEGDLTDSEGGADGVALGAAGLIADSMVGDEALQVNGAGDYVEVFDADSMKFGIQDSYALTAWAKPAPGTSGYRGVITKGRDAEPWWGIWINPADQWLYGVSANNNLVSTAVAFDEWSHVAIVQDGSTNTRLLYVNGELQGTGPATDAMNVGNLAMGGALSVDEWFVGLIDDVRIYDEALDEPDIVALASGGTVPPTREALTDVDAVQCPPSGRGPLTVTISQPVPDGADPAERVTVVERLTGPVTAALVDSDNGGIAADIFLTDVEAVGPFDDHRDIIVNPECPDGNGDAVEDAAGVYTLTSVGEDIWQNGDTFHFAYNVVSGNFDVTAHVLERVSAVGGRWGKHGVMARQDLTHSSRYTFTHDNIGDVDAVTGAPENNDDSTRQAGRPTHGGDDNYESTPYPSNPSGDGVDDYCDGAGPDNGTCEVVHDDYLRLERVGSVFTSYSRGDPGDPWTVLGQHDWGASAPVEVLVGLAVTSHSSDCASPAAITFDEVDYGDATVVPVETRPVGVQITWDISRAELAAGIGYTVNLTQGDIFMTGTAADVPVIGVGSVSMMCDSRVTGLTCIEDVNGGLDLAWENHGFADPGVAIQVLINGTDAGAVPGDATSTTVAADLLDEGFNQICLINSSGLPACCGFYSGVAVPIHHWEFEGDFEDSVGAADGTPMGLAALSDDARIGDQALQVNGAGDHLEVLDLQSLQFAVTDSYSIAAWVKPSSVFGASWKGVVTKGRDLPPWFGIWISPNNQWTFGSSGNDIEGGAVTFDEWAHVAVVQNGPLGTREIYVDGALGGTDVAHDAVNTGSLAMGGALSVDEWLIGQIDDVRFYNVPLDLAHVQALAADEVVHGIRFQRGDADANGAVNITDGIFVLNFLFLGGSAPLCHEAANSNDDAEVNITDGIYILNFLFLGGPAPPDPHGACGWDPTPGSTTCDSFPPCF
jgi:hypothetical protein